MRAGRTALRACSSANAASSYASVKRSVKRFMRMAASVVIDLPLVEGVPENSRGLHAAPRSDL